MLKRGDTFRGPCVILAARAASNRVDYAANKLTPHFWQNTKNQKVIYKIGL